MNDCVHIISERLLTAVDVHFHNLKTGAGVGGTDGKVHTLRCVADLSNQKPKIHGRVIVRFRIGGAFAVAHWDPNSRPTRRLKKPSTLSGLWLVPRDRDIAAQREEELWAERVEAARSNYICAESQLHKVIVLQKEWPLPEPKASAVIEAARLQELATHNEYLRLLKIFTELLVAGEDPKTTSNTG